MAVEVFMPKAGMDMKEGKIINWLVEVGDEVKEGDGILEIETDKVTMEVEAPADGTLLCKYFEDGATVPVVTVIGYIGEKGEKVPDGPSVAGGEENKEEVKKEVEETVVKTETVVNTNRQKGDIPATPYQKLKPQEFMAKLKQEIYYHIVKKSKNRIKVLAHWLRELQRLMV